jgi:hypothetical protein
MEALVVLMAEKNRDGGYRRIEDAWFNLGHELARSSIAQILERHGIEPAPERSRKTRWKEFLGYLRSAKRLPASRPLWMFQHGIARKWKGAAPRISFAEIPPVAHKDVCKLPSNSDWRTASNCATWLWDTVRTVMRLVEDLQERCLVGCRLHQSHS